MSFPVGETVELKSGGPIMTVIEAGSDAFAGEPHVSCKWFDSAGKVQSESFPPAALRKAQNP